MHRISQSGAWRLDRLNRQGVLGHRPSVGARCDICDERHVCPRDRPHWRTWLLSTYLRCEISDVSTRRTEKFFAASTSPSTRARRSASSGRTGRASRRCFGSWRVSTMALPARLASLQVSASAISPKSLNSIRQRTSSATSQTVLPSSAICSFASTKCVPRWAIPTLTLTCCSANRPTFRRRSTPRTRGT